MADARETLLEVARCADSWDPEACLLGNVKAGDIVAAITALDAEVAGLRTALEYLAVEWHPTEGPCFCRRESVELTHEADCARARAALAPPPAPPSKTESEDTHVG
jgi:hypothetical protein